MCQLRDFSGATQRSTLLYQYLKVFFAINKLEEAAITKLAGGVTIILIDLTLKMR